MIDIDLILVGADRLEAEFRSLPDAVQRAVSAKMQSLVLKVEAETKSKLSGRVLNVRSGALRRSIQSRVTSLRALVRGSIFSAGDVKYGAIHEFGGTTPPHIIEAKEAKSLAFLMGGKMMFRKRVNHPGSKMPERSFLRSSLKDLTDDIIDGLEEAVVQGIKDA